LHAFCHRWGPWRCAGSISVITRITIENFKSLKSIDLNLKGLNLFIGTNASGKSNFFDALRVLQGIGYGFTIHEILDGKPKSASREVWDAIRGGSQKALWAGATPGTSILFRVEGVLDNIYEFEYEVGFDPMSGRIRLEKLNLAGKTLYESLPLVDSDIHPTLTIKLMQGSRGRRPHLDFERTRPVLAQLARAESTTAKDVSDLFANMQRIDPVPSLLRGYSQAHEISRMGERGENFAALVRTICKDSKKKSAFLSWLQELRPTVSRPEKS